MLVHRFVPLAIEEFSSIGLGTIDAVAERYCEEASL